MMTSEKGDNVKTDDVEEGEDDDVEEEDVEEDRSQDHAHTLCEPAQPKCIGTFHNSHFIQKCAGKMPQPKFKWSTLIKHRPLRLPQEPFSVDTLFGEKKRPVPVSL